jgi:hypothetical protein
MKNLVNKIRRGNPTEIIYKFAKLVRCSKVKVNSQAEVDNLIK